MTSTSTFSWDETGANGDSGSYRGIYGVISRRRRKGNTDV